jgi:hypothetical protein
LRLLLDTNVLLLFIVGTLKPAAIGGKRLRDCDLDDFHLVENLAARTPAHTSTPHVLAEVSNFLGSGRQELVSGGTDFLAEYILLLEEIFVPAKEVVGTAEFSALGLTDAAIYQLASSETRVVSMDFHLCNRLASKGVEVINPRNLRTPGYVPA